MRKQHHPRRLIMAALVLAAAGLAVAVFALPSSVAGTPAGIEWGVTFSTKQCAHLGVRWREAYRAVLDDLRPAVVRLVAYWDRVEPQRHVYDFAVLDEQVRGAEAAGVPVVIAVGQKAPRWPEYHFPRWLDARDTGSREAELLGYVETVVLRYRDRPGLRYWQVENEPFLAFGEGPEPDEGLLEREIALVHALDARHPVLVTDGGEWGSWVQAASAADVFGTTLYRGAYDRRIGAFTYPLTPAYYALKGAVTRVAVWKPHQRFICAELAAEPWGEAPIPRLSVTRQRGLFPPASVASAASFAERAGFEEVYFWGVEWWYLRKIEGDPAYWETAKRVMKRPASVRPSRR